MIGWCRSMVLCVGGLCCSLDVRVSVLEAESDEARLSGVAGAKPRPSSKHQPSFASTSPSIQFLLEVHFVATIPTTCSSSLCDDKHSTITSRSEREEVRWSFALRFASLPVLHITSSRIEPVNFVRTRHTAPTETRHPPRWRRNAHIPP